MPNYRKVPRELAARTGLREGRMLRTRELDRALIHIALDLDCRHDLVVIVRGVNASLTEFTQALGFANERAEALSESMDRALARERGRTFELVDG